MSNIPNALAVASACYGCWDERTFLMVQVYLLNQIATTGGVGGGNPLVTYTSGTPATPTNPNAPAYAYDPNGILPNMGWNVNNQTWT